MVDDAGNLVVNWYVESRGRLDTVTVGDATFYSGPYGSELLTKLSPKGAILWARQIVSGGNLLISDVVIDVQGHVYVSGEFDGLSLRLDGKTLRKQDLQADRVDGFVAHYDADGQLRWTYT